MPTILLPRLCRDVPVAEADGSAAADGADDLEAVAAGDRRVRVAAAGTTEVRPGDRLEIVGAVGGG